MSAAIRGRIPIKRALVSVYDKTGLEELVRGLHDAGVALVSTGGSAALIEGARPAGHQGRGPHRLPRVPRRPGQDAAPARCTPASSPTAASTPTSQQLAELGVEPFDLVVSNLYPFTADRRLGRDARRVRRADRHRRPVDGARRRQEPPLGRDRHLARRATPTCSRRSPAGGFTLAAAPARSPPRRSCTPRRTTSPSRPGWATCSPTPPTAPASRRGSARPGRRRRCCATARTRTSRPRSTSTASARRPRRRPSSCTARRCPTTTTSTPTPPAARRTTSPSPRVAIIKHANPCGIAVGADVAEAHRKAHACDPVSAFGGVIATNRPVSVEMAEQVAEIFTEVIVAPAYDDGAVEVLPGQEEHPDPGAPTPTPAPAGRDPADLRRPADAAARPRRRRRRRPGDLDARHRRGGVGRGARRPGVRLAGLPRGEVQRDPARHGRRLGRRRHGPGQPGRLLQARRRRGRGSGPRARSPRPTRSSRSPTARRS